MVCRRNTSSCRHPGVIGRTESCVSTSGALCEVVLPGDGVNTAAAELEQASVRAQGSHRGVNYANVLMRYYIETP